LASASGDKTLRVWDMRGNEVSQFVSQDCLTGVAFLKADHVVYSSLNETIGIVKWQTGELVQVLSGHTDSTYDIDILPGSRAMLSVSLDKYVILWSAALEPGFESWDRMRWGRDDREHEGLPVKSYTLNRTFVGHKVRAKTYLIRRADASRIMP
jgi:WD40 repeat protein